MLLPVIHSCKCSSQIVGHIYMSILFQTVSCSMFEVLIKIKTRVHLSFLYSSSYGPFESRGGGGGTSESNRVYRQR